MEVYTTEQIRNVVLLSHSGAGKTTLAEALLFNTGALSRQGKVEEGNTTSDYEPEEIKRRSSVQTALVPCEWKGTKINILDSPGYADFLGEMLAALAVAEGAILLVDATAGVQVGTEQAWNYIRDKGLPCLIYISQLDRENASFSRTLSTIQARLGRQCVPLQAPTGTGGSFQGMRSLISPPGEADEFTAKYMEELAEAIAESDDELTSKYLEKGALSSEELRSGLKAAFMAGKVVPVAGGAAHKNIGAKELLDIIIDLFPRPGERPSIQASLPNAADKASIASDARGPLAALVFKTSADPYVGKLSYFRVYRGTMASDSHVWNASKGTPERLGQLFIPRGKLQQPIPRLLAGDIGVVAKLADAGTGDTLCLREASLLIDPVVFPNPSYEVSVAPKTKADLDKMGMALNRLCEEDPSLKLRKDPSTNETILAGRGESHIDVSAEKLKRKFGVEVTLGMPKIPYRETIKLSVQAEYKHKKQTGGHGQFGHVFLRLEPLPKGSGIEFAEHVVGGAVPKNFIPAVEKGVKSAVQEGVVAHYPMVDMKVTLYDGSYHPVDSSDMSFQIAGNQAVKKGVAQAQPILLEPIVHLKVMVPDSYTGDIIGDLNSKRAKVHGMYPENGMTNIEAEAPLAEVLRYSTVMRSLTQGRGQFTMSLSHYEEVPPHLSQKIIQEVNKQQG